MDERPIPLKPGEISNSIPPASSSIAAVGVSGLESTVPEFHRTFLKNLGVRMQAGEDVTVQDVSRAIVGAGSKQIPSQHLVRGDTAMDLEKGVRVTVIKCAVGRTKKGSPIHRVVCRGTGESWKVSERKLRKLN